MIELDPPELAYGERMEEILSEAGTPQDADLNSHVSILHSLPFDASDDRLFASCIAIRRNFYIDPYGQMTFCSYIKDPTLQYDLRHGTLQEAWETFIPSLADKVRGGNEYHENCGNCEKRTDCHWCAVYARLKRAAIPLAYRTSALWLMRPARSGQIGKPGIAAIFELRVSPCAWKAMWISTLSSSRTS